MKKSKNYEKDRIKFMLEEMNIIDFEMYIDFEENRVNVNLSGVFEDLNNGIYMASKDVFPVHVYDKNYSFLTSGIAPAEKKLMDEQSIIFQNKQKKLTSGEIGNGENAKFRVISGV